MKRLLYLSVLLIFVIQGFAQEDLKYQKPPKEILELADFERAPGLSMDSKMQKMLFMYRSTYKTLQDLSEEEMKLAGLRINPKTNISSTVTYIDNIKYKTINEPDAKQVSGLPQNPRLSNFSWSPDEAKVAFTNTTAKGVELWVFDFTSGAARKLTNDNLNANLGMPFTWYRSSDALLALVLPKDKPALISSAEVIPEGPTVSVSEKGAKAQNRTYQDLLQNATDEANFETLVTSELYKVDLNGSASLWKGKDIYSGFSFSPDGKYLMVITMHRPYSYIVPLYRFPTTTNIYDINGKLISNFHEKPLIEIMPKGFMATTTGKRGISWRADKPATLHWVEALDNGDPEVKVDYRDEVFELDALLTVHLKVLLKQLTVTAD